MSVLFVNAKPVLFSEQHYQSIYVTVNKCKQ
jgi:hypothetical protein